MSTVTFDTLKFADRLEKAGLTREQAAAFAEEQKDVFSEALDTTLATKSDVADLKTELAVIRWMLGVVLAVALANFAKQFF
ncbi:MAG: hypothetical protein IPH08_00320 [Rhodocyclaceae bacterium]|nr:hypothetical protein [Rhodocyclaceae bacterium]